MVYEILYKESVKKDLKNIEIGEAKRILDKIEKVLLMDPWAGKPLSGKYKGLYKFRVGNHRVIYVIGGSQIWILKIGHRKHVYR